MTEEMRDNLDNREWSEKHLEAAGRLPRPSVAALTPPQRDQPPDGRAVDVRGPDGYTPLMIASFCASKAARRQSAAAADSDSTGSTDLEVEDTAAIISDLISQGAAVNAATDRTGEDRVTKRKRKGRVYSAFLHQGTYKALRHGSHSFTCKGSK